MRISAWWSQRFALAVPGEVGAGRDTDLARRPVHDLLGGFGGVLEEPAEVAHRAELHREPEAVDIAAPSCDLTLVIVAEAEAACELVS